MAKLLNELGRGKPAIPPSFTPCPLALADRDRREALRDQQSLTAAFFGDPLPGMSALDRRERERPHWGRLGAFSSQAELDDATVATVPDIADDPELTPQKKDRTEALRQSLHRLSPEHREVIDLAYYHGKSVKEIAEIVGITEATVNTRMFYARRKLAELVETI
jgi:RNA polymerase sigma factor (sigma-70 family)